MEQFTNNPVATSHVGPGFSPPPPRIGPQVPGMTGGLPGLAGLSVTKNPMAEQLQSYGRGDDKMLVHMTPAEVQSLRGLAQLTGGDLTRNPHTGLPEAGWLGNLLPTLLGGLGALFGLPTWAIGLGGAVGGTAATGNLGKGLMMGLQAFGGAGLANALGGNGAITNLFGKGSSGVTGAAGATGAAATPTVVPPAAMPATTGVNMGALPTNVSAGATLPATTGFNFGAMPTSVSAGASLPATSGIVMGNTAVPAMGGSAALANLGPSVVGPGGTAVPGATGFLDKFKQSTAIPGLGKLGATVGPYAAGLGLLTGVGSAFEKKPPKDEEEKTNFPYKGPYMAHRTQYPVEPIDLRSPNASFQRRHFSGMTFTDKDGNTFIPGTATAKPEPYYAGGGHVQMDEGSFVFPARETAELGNGSSRAGQEVLARLGGRPIDGKGDGVSDSIPARIGGEQKARVARDEVYFSPQAVQRVGGGDHKRGTQKLYALMDKATKARKRAAVGADTKLRRGLA